MSYEIEIRDHLYKIFKKMKKKERQKLEIINRKIKGIKEDPTRYKQLKAPMQHLRRVHIAGSFVLIFSIDEKRKTVILEEFAHHDEAYK